MTHETWKAQYLEWVRAMICEGPTTVVLKMGQKVLTAPPGWSDAEYRRAIDEANRTLSLAEKQKMLERASEVEMGAVMFEVFDKDKR